MKPKNTGGRPPIYKARRNCEPAYSVIKRIGMSHNALAGALGVSVSTVGRWCLEDWAGGTGGVIPLTHWEPLKKLARLRGVKLTRAELAGDFVGDAPR